MTVRTCLVVTVALAVLATTACSRKPEPAPRLDVTVGPKGVSVGVTAAKSKVDVKAPAPAAPAAVKLPAAWPKEFVLPAGAIVTETNETEGKIVLDLKAPGKVEALVEYYVTAMAKQGWKQESKGVEAGEANLEFTRPGRKANVHITDGEGAASLTLTATKVTEE